MLKWGQTLKWGVKKQQNDEGVDRPIRQVAYSLRIQPLLQQTWKEEEAQAQTEDKSYQENSLLTDQEWDEPELAGVRPGPGELYKRGKLRKEDHIGADEFGGGYSQEGLLLGPE